jgi:hypothetical protein
LTVGIFVAITGKPRYAYIDEDKSVFLDYKAGKINIYELNQYKEGKGFYAMRIGAALAISLIGLGATVHGFKLINVTKIIRKGDGQWNLKKKQN